MDNRLKPAENSYQIFCDLDGVLTDFESAFPKELNPDIHLGTMTREWWANMPFMESGKLLWNYIKQFNPHILSSPGRSLTEEQKDIIRSGKLEWIAKHLDITIDRIHIRSDKYAMVVNHKSILIDDWAKNTIIWEKHGGTAITHDSKDLQKTLDRLKELGF